MIKVTETRMPGVLKINRDIFRDDRGFQFEVYNRQDFFAAGITTDFIQDNISYSKINVLRGLHGDDETWKLLSCLFGELYFVVVNYDPNSKYFGRWQSFNLTPQNNTQILVPPKHLNGHLVMSDEAVFHYKLSEYYKGAENQFSVQWNDPRFNISWPTEKPELSPRDGG